MPGSTVSSTLTIAVTLGGGAYPSPLTVTATGAITPAAYGANGVYAAAGAAGVRLVNHGSIAGAAGTTGRPYAPPGAGVYFAAAGTIGNSGSIAGGSVHSNGGYAGGIGIDLAAGGRLTNAGAISGGQSYNAYGGTGAALGAGGTIRNLGTIAGGRSTGFGGYGAGLGVALYAGGRLVNAGAVRGGDSDHGQGGTAVLLRGDGTVVNSGSILGGAPGPQSYYPPGTGIRITDNGTVTNTGVISGGSPLYGFGGAGVAIEQAGKVTNDGRIFGGQGSGYGAGGNGVDLSTGGRLFNAGLVAGGAGGSPASGAGGAGGTGVYLDGGRLVTAGTISGGAGGVGPGGTGAAGAAVRFGAAAGRLVIDPGAVFNGDVMANASVNDVLELAGTLAGTLGGLGTQFSGFTTVDQDAGARTRLGGANTLGSGTLLRVGGDFTVAGSLDDAGAARVLRHGTLLAGAGSTLQVARVSLDGGALGGERGSALVIGTDAAAATPDRVTVQAGAEITGAGRVGAPGGSDIVDNGAIVARGGRLELARAVSGDGSVTIASGATLVADLGLGVAAVKFAAGAGGMLVLTAPSAVTSPIAGFGSGDTIGLAGIQATSARFVGRTLRLLDAQQAVVDEIRFIGDYRDADFSLREDSHGTTVSFASGAVLAAEAGPPLPDPGAPVRIACGLAQDQALSASCAAATLPMPGTVEAHPCGLAPMDH